MRTSEREIDLSEARDFVLSLMPQVGRLLMREFRSGNFTQRSKGNLDFSIEADDKADKFLVDRLSKRFPATLFLTEETVPEYFTQLRDADNLWVIDSLDGTSNFSRGHPNFAVSVALVQRGISVLGVVYKPVDRSFLWAQADFEGAMLNGLPMRVSNIDDLSKSVFLCDWYPIPDLRVEMRNVLEEVESHVRQIKSMGSAVADLCEIAIGRADAYIQPGLKPWDVAASSLIITKAGGRITRVNGDSWNVFTPDIFASNGLLHPQILELIS